jgi:hypothetical protein
MHFLSRLAPIVLLLLASPLLADDFEIKKIDDGLEVSRGGKLVTRYLVKSGAKPILWPVIGPYGNEITRAFPMRDAGPDERADHHHHRSFWFTHGDVNGIDFWSEGDGHGDIEHRKFVKVKSGAAAVIITQNDWVGPDKTKICEDERRLTFGSDGSTYWIDFDVTVTASEGPVVFGDTKEGSFGVRIAGSIKVTAEKGGRIINSHGDMDVKAWGKQSPWVDYHGPLNGKKVGIAIMNHPSSFRYPTYWHVRTYGLFTANPFGLHHFKGSNDFDGSHKLEKGETMQLRYRVLFHPGDEKQAGVAERFAEYAKIKK